MIRALFIQVNLPLSFLCFQVLSFLTWTILECLTQLAGTYHTCWHGRHPLCYSLIFLLLLSLHGTDMTTLSLHRIVSLLPQCLTSFLLHLNDTFTLLTESHPFFYTFGRVVENYDGEHLWTCNTVVTNIVLGLMNQVHSPHWLEKWGWCVQYMLVGWYHDCQHLFQPDKFTMSPICWTWVQQQQVELEFGSQSLKA